MVSTVLTAVSRIGAVRRAAVALPVTNALIGRFIAGDELPDVVEVTRRLTGAGLQVTIDHLGEDTTVVEQADATTQAYVRLLTALGTAGLAEHAEVSLKLSAIGQFLGSEGEAMALENGRLICSAARAVGTTVTLDMEDHTTTDSTLQILSELRATYPETGAVLQAYLRRTEADCRALAGSGSRVRLCKGAYAEPAEVAHTSAHEIDKAYVRCLKILMQGEGYPMVATHDPRLIAIAIDLAERFDRTAEDWELQMLHGVRPNEQLRLANAGHRMRVYVPYGTDWYGYMVRRMAEKPANLALFLRSLTSKD